MFETITVVVMSTLIIGGCVWSWWLDNHGAKDDSSKSITSENEIQKNDN